MRVISSLLVLGAALSTCEVHHAAPAATTANVRLFCASIYFPRGTEPGAEFSLEFTSIPPGINNEFPPNFEGPYSHAGPAALHDEIFETRIPGGVYLDLPEVPDSNGDGISDFFDSTQAINGQSAGEYSFQGFPPGTIRASWSRPANSISGTCVLRFRPNDVFVWKTFTHTFSILEYRGKLDFIPGPNSVRGTIHLSQTEFSENTFTGEMVFQKNSADPHNLLVLQPGSWTNAFEQSLSFLHNTYERDARWPTNYLGWFDFADGDLNSSEPDYFSWTLSIDDLNDSDTDSVPDFSDEPGNAQPAQPSLSFTLSTNSFVLTVQTVAGRPHRLQQSPGLAPAQWTVVNTFVPTNTVQTFVFPVEDSPGRFWRVALD